MPIVSRFCTNCGHPVQVGNNFCTSCGRVTTPPTGGAPPAATADAAFGRPSQVGFPGTGATEEERYLGGFTSGHLKPTGLGNSAALGGCGVYATSRRILVVKSGKGYWGLLDLTMSIAPVLIGDRKMRADSSPVAVAELEQNKYFDVKKEDISGIEVRKGWNPLFGPV